MIYKFYPWVPHTFWVLRILFMVLISQRDTSLHSDRPYLKTGFLFFFPFSPERACVNCLYKCQIVDSSSLQRMEDNHFNDIFILKKVFGLGFGFFFFFNHRVDHFSQIRDGWESNIFNSQKVQALLFCILHHKFSFTASDLGGQQGRAGG